MFTKAIIALLAAAPSALAAPSTAKPIPLPADQATVLNSCSYSVNLWSVDPSGSSAMKTLQPGQIYQEAVRVPCPDCGVSLKISKSDSVARPLQFEYSLKGGLTWYDISLIDCVNEDDASGCPGHEGGLVATGAQCPTLYCAPGAVCKNDAYYVPVPGEQQPVQACKQGQGIGFELCAGH